jgi:predicted component of type VI protein secretion system
MGFVTVSRNGQEVARHPLGPTPLIAGRLEECSIPLPCEFVSRQHAVLVEKDGVAAIRNLSASNRAILNGVALEGSARLRPGDRIQIGTFVLEYSDQAPAPATPAEGPGAKAKTRILPLPPAVAAASGTPATPPAKPAATRSPTRATPPEAEALSTVTTQMFTAPPRAKKAEAEAEKGEAEEAGGEPEPEKT